MSDDIEILPEDALQVAQRALAKANRIDDVEQELADLQDQVTALELRLSEFDDERDYRDLSRDEKIGMVREYAFERATSGRGRTFDVSDIREGLFDGKPSRDHCYDLMRWAGEATGFEYREPSGRKYHLRVDPDRAREARLYSATTTASAGGV